MEVYYCEKCKGRPYTRKIRDAKCPDCGALLKFEDVSEDSLAGRRELVYPRTVPDFKDIHLKDLIMPQEKDDAVRNTQFSLTDGEVFYEYLGFEKTGSVDFSVRFILGNQPDGNSVITKTPFVSPKIKFVQNLELSELELMRKSFERAFVSLGFENDRRMFHAFVKRGDGVLTKTKTEVYDEERLTEEDRFSERYFINYDYQPFGGISVTGPFTREHGFFDEVKRVIDSRYEKFMEYMVFRARNGDNMTLSSFADDSAVIFDDPHLALIRYDRLLKEARAARM
ncbi:hypothetical protein [Ruminococcus sp. HUN007]|uniref:hypothetical protein n=1 Tax=Ruminococcus sp. HUN007 TaxID=1514668 RepID=UPI0005D258E6|nr:hypothetical protein [Ruminococcus sp. HUN007]